MDIPEDELLKELKQGRETAYRKLFYQYFEPLVFFANQYLQDVDASKDIVQNVMSQLYQGREELNINTSLKSYLYRAVTNRSLNEIKSRKVHLQHHYEIRAAADTDYQENSIELNELQLKINKVIEGLPERTREVFKMSRFDHKTNQEIADELNLSKRTVETQISNALKVLRGALSILLLQIILKNFH